MKRKYVVTGIVVAAIVAFFVLAPVVSLTPNDKTGSLVGYKGWGTYYSYGNQTIIYWSHVTYPKCGPWPGCPIGFSNASSPEYLPMPTYGSLSYYLLGSGGLAFENGYTMALCVGNSSADVYCQLPVPCFNNQIPWPHDGCF